MLSSNALQMHPHASLSPSPVPAATGSSVPSSVIITSSRVARAIAELNVKYPTHRFSAKPDGGLVIDEIATGERATSCPDPECARVFAYKRSNCVSRHVQTEHAPDTLPFVCCSPCTSRTNRRDHFVAHLARKKAQCAAAILARWTESDIDLMMKLVYPSAARAGYGAWRQALVHDTNPEHLEAQLRKLGLTTADVLGNGNMTVAASASPLPTGAAPAATTAPSLMATPAPAPVLPAPLPPLPPVSVSPMTHSVPVSMATLTSPLPASMNAFVPTSAAGNTNMFVPNWATLTPPPPAPNMLPTMPYQQPQYMPQHQPFAPVMTSSATPFPTLASSAWESWPPAPSPVPNAFAHAPHLAPSPMMVATSTGMASPMLPLGSASSSMTPDPFLPASQAMSTPFMHAGPSGLGVGGALPSPAFSPVTLATSAPQVYASPVPDTTTLVNGMLSPLAPTSKKRSRSAVAASEADDTVTDYNALLFGFAPNAALSQSSSGNGDSQPPATKRARTDVCSNSAAWLQLPSPVLAPMATY